MKRKFTEAAVKKKFSPRLVNKAAVWGSIASCVIGGLVLLVTLARAVTN